MRAHEECNAGRTLRGTSSSLGSSWSLEIRRQMGWKSRLQIISIPEPLEAGGADEITQGGLRTGTQGTSTFREQLGRGGGGNEA